MNTDFGAEEFSHLVADKRIAKRINMLFSKFIKTPVASIPQACQTPAAIKAAYRVFANESIRVGAIINAHAKKTGERISTQNLALVAHDTTNADFSSHKKTKNIGYLDTKFGRGIKLHSSLAISETGVPLGLLYQKAWVRNDNEYGKKSERKNKQIVDKESYRWLEGMRASREVAPSNVTLIHVADRESDIYEYINEILLFPNNYPLIRACHDRKIITSDGSHSHLFTTISEVPVAFETTVHIARRGADRHPEAVQCDVRYTPVTLLPPSGKVGLIPLKLWGLSIREKGVEKGGIEWILLSGLPVESAEDARRMISYYTMRWLIERFHYTLKSGCRVEELQLEEASRLMRAIELYSVVALRILRMTYEARISPASSASSILSELELKLLVILLLSDGHRRVDAPKTLGECVHMIARLGGFLGRKSDGFPGVITLWRGLRRLEESVNTVAALKKHDLSVIKVVGNG